MRDHLCVLRKFFRMSWFFVLVCALACMSPTAFSVSGLEQSSNFSTQNNIMKSPLSSAVDKFTLDFLKSQAKLGSENNVLLSPLSIQVIYSLLMKGARGETRDDIFHALCLSSFESHDDVFPEIGKMLGILTRENQNITLLISNLLGISNDYQIESEFKETARKYRSEIFVENFRESEGVKTKINEWVNRTTEGKISKILDSSLASDTILVLLNTIYFQGSWITPFQIRDTTDKNFRNADGTNSTVPMMELSIESFPSYSNSEFQMLEMPYSGNVSMIFLLPKTNVEQIISNLSDAKLTDYIKSMRSTNFDWVNIPKFKIEAEYKLHQILPGMGMRKPFVRAANFSGIAPIEMKIDKSLHKAVIEVDERGTVAAAATSIKVVAESFHEPVYFVLDRPFIFFLREKTHSINLFAGIINKLSN